MQLSQHFSVEEFMRSSAATRLGIDNAVPAALLENAAIVARMMENVRQFLCDKVGKEIAIVVSSGYRCPALNRAVGSAGTSDHLLALAMDWRAPTFGTPTEIATALAPFVTRLGIGQLINEFPDADGWVHTSAKIPTNPNNRIITIKRLGTVVGIVS